MHTPIYTSWATVASAGLATKSWFKERGLRAVLDPVAHLQGQKFTCALYRRQDCLPIGSRTPTAEWLTIHRTESHEWANTTLATQGRIAHWLTRAVSGIGPRIAHLALITLDGRMVLQRTFERNEAFAHDYDDLASHLSGSPLLVWDAPLAKTQLDDMCAYSRVPSLSPQMVYVGRRYDRYLGRWELGGFKQHPLPCPSDNPLEQCHTIRRLIHEMATQEETS